jgi:light-regulated signal transduction histidine kinase (bacteriophytochrome)
MSQKHQDMDATFCGRIPLHQTNLIQPQGVLLVIDEQNWTVIQASANATDILNCSIENILNISVEEIFDAVTVANIKLNKGSYNFSNPVELTLKNTTGTSFFSVVHEKYDCLLIEIEIPDYTSSTQSSFNHFFGQVQNIMSAINSCTSVTEVAAVAAKHIKHISGFDKVMIYSFDEQWIGTVIAEEMEPGMDSYLGLRFPSSDIPKQARELYLKNPYRLIPNRAYKAVPLIPELNPLTNAPTDMSDCKFRSVVSVHLEYLKNMNVTASMSTRIIHKERLWGLIACHHRTAKYLSFQECSLFEFFSNIISSKIASLLYKYSSAKQTRLTAQYEDILSQINQTTDFNSSLRGLQDQLLMLLSADGIAICNNLDISLFGETPTHEQIIELREWLQQQSIRTTQWNDLPLHYSAAKEFSGVASGLLALAVQPYEGNYILAFRNEVIKSVSWGGDPNQVVHFEPNSTKYHPRNSFSIWQETVRYTSEPWSNEEVDIAERLRIALVELTLLKLTAGLEQEVFKRTEELHLTNSKLESTHNELMQVLYVTSHDLNEPVRKIQVYGNMLKDALKDPDAGNQLERLLGAAKRISSLIESLLHYSRLSQKMDKVPVDLNAIIADVQKDLELSIAEQKAVFTIGELPRINAVPDQMRQVFHSLINNALKFSKEGVQIDIYTERVLTEQRSSDQYKIIIKDTGIGFNPEYAEYIFNMFRKFHTEYEGAGLGLAVARKIIENHGGTLTANAEENKGAEFIITLPVV